MLVQFSIVPVGSGSSIGDSIAAVIKIVKDSGLPYRVNPMGTVVEGQWGEVMGLIRKCHAAVMKTKERAVTTISIDDRKGRRAMIDQKVKSIERRLGRKLRR